MLQDNFLRDKLSLNKQTLSINSKVKTFFFFFLALLRSSGALKTLHSYSSTLGYSIRHKRPRRDEALKLLIAITPKGVQA